MTLITDEAPPHHSKPPDLRQNTTSAEITSIVLPVLPPRDQLTRARTNTTTWTPPKARQKPLKGRHCQKGTDLDLPLPKPSASTVGKIGGADGQANRRTIHHRSYISIVVTLDLKENT
ncbi:hypothetical protein TSUD_361650 [Trifolium subterraneum]|uniref:Uncharacterized protein n=1 Tax=Trifolium subterraneum TaxID=3900 RepID=A0A2Z6MMS1_TRISU|nr:hypothetical protein TSUD_361650 [Trifolium subterraneum]